MNKEFVSHELALKLKKLGFDEACFGRWLVVTEWEKPTGEIKLQLNVKVEEWDKNQCLAPTFSQALRWFREKHNLCGEVYTVNMGAIDYTFQIRDLYSEDVKHDNFEAYTGGYIGTFLIYEEAESACLNKLIEIVEN